MLKQAMLLQMLQMFFVPLSGDFAFQIEATGTKLIYSISGVNSFYFSVNPDTGIVIVNSPLDREVCFFHLVTAAVSYSMIFKPKSQSNEQNTLHAYLEKVF